MRILSRQMLIFDLAISEMSLRSLVVGRLPKPSDIATRRTYLIRRADGTRSSGPNGVINGFDCQRVVKVEIGSWRVQKYFANS